jgi:hypothetical protein
MALNDCLARLRNTQNITEPLFHTFGERKGLTG